MAYSYCPSCGTKYSEAAHVEDFGWHCESCDYTYFESLRTTATALIMQDNMVLLVKRGIDPEKGTWDLPGGFVRPDEHPEQAVVRELAEELGVVARVRQLYLVNSPGEYLYKGHIQFTCDHLYLCEIVSGDPMPADDVAEFHWHSRTEIPSNDQVFTPIRPAFEKMRQDNNLWQA